MLNEEFYSRHIILSSLFDCIIFSCTQSEHFQEEVVYFMNNQLYIFDDWVFASSGMFRWTGSQSENSQGANNGITFFWPSWYRGQLPYLNEWMKSWRFWRSGISSSTWTFGSSWLTGASQFKFRCQIIYFIQELVKCHSSCLAYPSCLGNMHQT